MTLKPYMTDDEKIEAIKRWLPKKYVIVERETVMGAMVKTARVAHNAAELAKQSSHLVNYKTHLLDTLEKIYRFYQSARQSFEKFIDAGGPEAEEELWAEIQRILVTEGRIQGDADTPKPH